MNRKIELKVLSCLLIIIALGLFSAAWFYEGIINKVGFTLFGVYVLWIVFKNPHTKNQKTELFNLDELSAPWEEFFYDSAWNPDTLNLTPFEQKIIDELTESLPRHMTVYDWNLPYAESIILVIRREIVKDGFNHRADR